MNRRTGVARPDVTGTDDRRMLKEIAMKTALKPKSLPWLARKADLPDQVVETLWNKAFALAGVADVADSQAAGPRRQADAMQYLLFMLGHAGAQPAGAATPRPLAAATVCQ